MIVTFQSAAAGDVIMFGDVAQRMMKLMGKDVTDKGIVTVEQLPEAIARIKAAIEEDKQQRVGRMKKICRAPSPVAEVRGPSSP